MPLRNRFRAARRLGDFVRGSEQFERLMGAEARGESLKRRSVRGGALQMTASGIDFVLRVGSMAVLARLLVPEHFGLISMVTALTSVAERFKDLGLAVATVQQREINHRQVSTLFWLNTVFGVGIMLAVAGTAYPIALFYEDMRLVPITLALALSFFWGGLAIQHQALLRRQLRFAQLASVQIAANCLSIALAIILAANGAGYWALVAREVSRSVFTAVGVFLCFPWLPGRPARTGGIGSMLRFGGDVTAFNLVYFLGSSFDQILIGKMLGPAPLGIYRQGVQLLLAPISQFMYPVNSVAEAALSRLQTSAEEYRRFYRRVVGASSSVTMPVVVFVSVFADELVSILLGERWMTAAPILQVMGIATFIRPTISTVGFVMVTSGKSRRYLWLGVLETLILVVLIVVGSRWGIMGIVCAHVASTYVLLVPKLHWGFRETPVAITTLVEAVSRPLTASLLVAGVLIAVKQSVPLRGSLESLLLGASVAVPGYLAIWMLLPGGTQELRQMFTHLRVSLRSVSVPEEGPAAG